MPEPNTTVVLTPDEVKLITTVMLAVSKVVTESNRPDFDWLSRSGRLIEKLGNVSPDKFDRLAWAKHAN